MCRLFGQSRHQGGRQAASVATYNEHDSYLRQWRRLTPSQREEQWYCFRAGSSVRRLLVSCKTDPTLRRAGIVHKCAHRVGDASSSGPSFSPSHLLPSFLLSLPPPPSLLSLSPDLSIASSVTLTFWTATPKTEGTPSAHVASQLIQHRCNVNMLRTCHKQHQVCCAIASQVFSFRLFLESAVALVFWCDLFGFLPRKFLDVQSSLRRCVGDRLQGSLQEIENCSVVTTTAVLSLHHSMTHRDKHSVSGIQLRVRCPHVTRLLLVLRRCRFSVKVVSEHATISIRLLQCLVLCFQDDTRDSDRHVKGTRQQWLVQPIGDAWRENTEEVNLVFSTEKLRW